jgi:asparagine synthase (glutamine-hydrolysing)
MCGIAGYVGKGNEEELKRMIGTLTHRGPDNQQVYIKDQVGFSHSRLSIIDLDAAANQPFTSEDGNVVLIFNGEIYNYLFLRKQLEQKGISFRTNSDTEVLLKLYQHEGLELFEKLNGMFAFALYDFSLNKLILARDRIGEKPLYYGKFGNTLVFSSELKALLKHSVVDREIDFNALHHYLIFDYVPAPYSIFKNIFKVDPGSYVEYHEARLIQKKYWNINFSQRSLSFEEACNEFTKRFEEAVVSKLISDVPLGFFLSGGLDSSSVAYFAQKNSRSKIKTFSIGFEDKSYDESVWAKQVAEFLGTEHHSQVLTQKQTLELIPFVSANMDEPFADPSIIPTYLLSSFTRQHVTVALGGDGSDELLAGYPTFLADRFLSITRMFPEFSISFLNALHNALPKSDRNISLDFKMAQFQKGFNAPLADVHTLWLSSFTPQSAKKLLNAEVYRGIEEPDKIGALQYHLQSAGSLLSEFNRNAFLYLKTYLPDDILVKVDRSSMLASLEVRSPFVDYTLIEFINSLPESYKRKGFKTKLLLKKSMEGKLPDNIIYRPKKGFGIPLASWLRNELKPLTDELLSENALSQHGYFNYAFVNKLKTDHQHKRANNRKEIWNLMIFQMWYLNYLK